MTKVSTHKPSHLRALLRKNWILWKRSWCVSLLEILVPFLFAFITIAFRQAAEPEDIRATSYLGNKVHDIQFNAILHTEMMKDCHADKNGGKIALAPQGNAIVNQLDTLFSSFNGLETIVFEDDNEINAYTSSKDYSKRGKNLCFAVVFTEKTPVDKYEYRLRWNTSSLGDPDIPNTNEDTVRISQLDKEDKESFRNYGYSGFLMVQNLVDNLILRQETNSGAKIVSSLLPIKTGDYTKDELAANMQGQTGMFLSLPLLLPYLRFINGMVREKEKRIREGMKIMGLRNSAFYFSWFITYFIIFTIISFLVSILLAAGFYKNATFGWIFLWHWEFSICLMALGFLVSVFFSKAKIANVAGFVVALLMTFFQFIVGQGSAPEGTFFGVSFAPHTSMAISGDHMLKLEAAQVGLNSDTITLAVDGYKMIIHYIVMALDIGIFILLGAYLDQVLPSEFGIRKHPLFCLQRNKKSRRNSKVSSEEEEQSPSLKENQENFEPTDPNLLAQDNMNESVKVKNLKKVYDNGKLAVDNVSFNMYKSQIFVLLGHNGAGKTTTISMITGLFDSTSGTTDIFGMDNHKNLDEIRKVMGICPQHDILFDDMTVKEHLELFAVFKGVSAENISQEVEKTIIDIGLVEKRDYLSKNLSGGQKRKLSIGIAFIGGSKFILLDEPSSGMDTSARRKLWDMLKNYKHNRVVLLTTHFMDEADYLGDRIGIMGEGKLKCLGRPLFLKNKFGVGYNLTIVKKDINDPSPPIIDLIKNCVPESIILSDVSAEITVQLPTEAAPKFKKLFESLDQSLDKLKVSTYGISVTTLEEVFLNVAKITTPDKHYHKEENSPDAIKDDLDDFDLKQSRIQNSWKLFWTHFWALVVKRVHYTKRDRRGLVCELFLPILMVIVGILITKTDTFKDDIPLPLNDHMYDDKFQVDYNAIVPADGSTISSNFISYFNSDAFTMTQKTANDLTTFDQAVFADQGQDIIDSIVNVFSVFVEKFDTTNYQFEYTAFINTRAYEGTTFAMNKINNAILKTAAGSQKEIKTIIAPFHKTVGGEEVESIFKGLGYSLIFSMGMSFIPASLITYIVKERELNAKHQQVVSGVTLTAYWFSNYFVDLMKYLIPGIVNSLLAMAFDATALIEGDKLGGLWAVFLLYGPAIISFVYLTSFLFRDYGSAQITSFFFNFGLGFIGGLAVSILRFFDGTRSVAKALGWILRCFPSFAMTFGFLNLANREILERIEDKDLEVFDAELVGGDVIFLILATFIYMLVVFLIEYLKNKKSLAGIMSGERSVRYEPKEIDDDVEREMHEIEKSDNKTYSIKVDKLRKVYALGGGQHKVAVDRLSFGVKNGECFALLGVNGAGKTTTFKILSGDYIQTSGQAYINGYGIPDELKQARSDIGYCPQFDALLENLTAKEHLYLYAAIKGIPAELRPRLVEKQLREMNLKQYENVPAGTYSGGNKRKLSVAIAMIGNPSVVFLDEPSTGMDPEARRFMWNVISRISRERKLSSIILTTHSMEEAEALATKMGIMVNGNLKCLGTSQHIKNKFGGGYEIEVKLNLPTKAEIDACQNSLGYKNEEMIDKAHVNAVLDKVQLGHLKAEIKEDGAGSAIYAELTKGTVSINQLAEWILIEKTGFKLQQFLKESFGEMVVLEHFQSFFRFRTTNKIAVGNFFGTLEQHKNELNVLQYSLRQTTIEQIFNNFATDKVLVKKGSHAAIDMPQN